MKRSYEMDLCSGPLLSKILLFSLPLILSGVLQLLFNATDIVVVGKFAGSNAMAAVGSTTSLFNLLVNSFIGISVGANVLVARHYGERDYDGVQQTIQTALLTGLIGGAILIVLGVVLARPMLTLMATPDEVIDQAVLYMQVYFIGMPATMIYNFGAAVLRAVGDTRRPLYFLMAAGVMNVLNKKSGVLGLSGVSSDFRDIEGAAAEGNERAAKALNAFNYRVIKYIGAYAAAMDGVDVIAFTAGLGENDKNMRKAVCSHLSYLGVKIDDAANDVRGKDTIISAPDSKVMVMVVPTNEELAIARETLALV